MTQNKSVKVMNLVSLLVESYTCYLHLDTYLSYSNPIYVNYVIRVATIWKIKRYILYEIYFYLNMLQVYEKEEI